MIREKIYTNLPIHSVTTPRPRPRVSQVGLHLGRMGLSLATASRDPRSELRPPSWSLDQRSSNSPNTTRR